MQGVEVMEMAYNNSNNKAYQDMLNNLLKDVFLDFKFWYDLDLWDEKYESYSFVDQGEIVSNICVFKTKIIFDGEQHSALSIGAVATKNEYRGRGLVRQLMAHIINKYENIPMYLVANAGVIDFYPKFGFERVYEKQPVYDVAIHNNCEIRKLSCKDPKVWRYVYERVNFSKQLDCMNTASINIFHLYSGYLENCIYELSEIETLVIAEQEGATLKLIAVFSLRDVSFSELIQYLPFQNISRIEFGFMPCWPDIEYVMIDRDTDPLFVRGVSCDLGEFKFPELSIT